MRTQSIQNGADINIGDKNGCTPLLLAAANHNKEAIDILISAGADVTKRDRYKKTAYDYAKNFYPSDSLSKLDFDGNPHKNMKEDIGLDKDGFKECTTLKDILIP